VLAIVVTDTEVCLNKKRIMQLIRLNHVSAKCISITEQWSQRVTWCNINHNQHVIAKPVRLSQEDIQGTLYSYLPWPLYTPNPSKKKNFLPIGYGYVWKLSKGKLCVLECLKCQ
jgi:hypothetical protein